MAEIPTLVPRPLEYSSNGRMLSFDPFYSLSSEGPGSQTAAELLKGYLQNAGLMPAEKSRKAFDIQLRSESPPVLDQAGFCDESYRLCIAQDQIQLQAANAQGLCRAVQCLRQLLPPEHLKNSCNISPFAPAPKAHTPGDRLELPECRIKDAPAYRWRGVHLDVSRHFFSLQDIARFIDLAALHRLNRVHLHLTDDQGWRFEVRRYPKLTRRGAWRQESLIGHYNDTPRRYDGHKHGGYYRQKDLIKLVDFAAQRAIGIVPEIDMPGHMQAAISAYPRWGCTTQRLPVRELWGISPYILNCEPQTIKAMQQILEELIDVFPSRFIHIGGDEAPKEQWELSKSIQKRMAQYACRNEAELQSWFIRQMDSFLHSRGRRTIGWDEILEGGLAEHAAVMSWRGFSGGIEAAGMGHDVVMTPQDCTYFDHYQTEPTDAEPLAIGGHTALHKVYAFDPVPPELDPKARDRILGAQAQLWTEYIPDTRQLDYMAYPRLCALAESLWLGPEAKDYEVFLRNLESHRQRLAALGVNAHPLPD